MAFGKPNYVRQALTLARSIKRHMPDIPISLITDEHSPDFSEAFDQILPLNKRFGKGVIQKLGLYEISPHKETIFIDADCVCFRDFKSEIAHFRTYDFIALGRSYLTGSDSHPAFSNLRNALFDLGSNRLPRFNGGFYYFSKSPLAENVFKKALDIYEKRKTLGIADYDLAGPAEEALFGLAMEQQGIDLFDDDYNLMAVLVGSQGRIDIDPRAGKCSFVKGSKRVCPAIVHFAGPSARSPEYQLCEYAFKGKISKSEYERRLRMLYLKQTLISLPLQRVMNSKTALGVYLKLRSSFGR